MLDLILTMKDIYINSNLNPLTEFTSSSRSNKLKVVFSWNMSQMITYHPNQRKNIHKLYKETGHSGIYPSNFDVW